jgi:hypothetical protein
LAGLQECIEHYPGKTLIAATRELRMRLLPVLGQLVDAAVVGPRYSVAQTERYHAEHLPKPQLKALRGQWLELKGNLKRVYASTSDDRAIFALMVNGAALFEDATFTDRRSFREACAACCALPPHVAAQVHDFERRFVPPNTVGSLELRNYVHSIVHASARGRYALRDEIKTHLHTMCKDYLEAMPGFRSGARRFAREPEHSPLLDKLFDQSVFQKFEFVALAA